MSGIQFNGFALAIDQIKSLALWSKLWSKPNEVIPQTKNPTISNMKSLDLWSSRAGQIRTFSFYPIGGQSVLKTDGLGAIFVVERDQHPVIVQKNSIHKNFNQRFPLLLLRNIELSKFHQPESDEILIEAGLLQFFICDFYISWRNNLTLR